MRPVLTADNLPPSCAVVTKSGKLNFLEPSGPFQACNGAALPLILNFMLKQCEHMDGSGSFSPAFHPQRSVLYPRSIRVGFLVERGALRQVVLRVLWFTPGSNILPLHDTHSFILPTKRYNLRY